MSNKRNLNSRAKKANVELVWGEDFVTAKALAIAITFGIADEDCQNDDESFNAITAATKALENAQLAQSALVDRKGNITREAEEDFVFAVKDKEVARDPELEDLITTLSEPSEDEEGDDEAKGSVVPPKYKAKYAAASDRKVDCGDWLADQMAELIVVPVVEGKKKTMTDLDRFEAICTSNGVDSKKMAALRTGNPGWQGRFRMTGRNLLTPLVAKAGVLFVPAGHGAKEDEERKAPKQWCLDNAPKEKAEPKAKKAAIPAAKGKGKAKPDAKKAKKPRAKKAAKTEVVPA